MRYEVGDFISYKPTGRIYKIVPTTGSNAWEYLAKSIDGKPELLAIYWDDLKRFEPYKVSNSRFRGLDESWVEL